MQLFSPLILVPLGNNWNETLRVILGPPGDFRKKSEAPVVLKTVIIGYNRVQGAFLHHINYSVLPVFKHGRVCALTPTRRALDDRELNIRHNSVEVDRLVN